MVNNLNHFNSLALKFIRELRDINIQSDKARFRKNMTSLGKVFAYEISKTLPYSPVEVETPLGSCEINTCGSPIVLAPILRAALPMYNGMLDFFEEAESAFISAYRKHHQGGKFEIEMQYITCPPLDGKTLIVIDPMLATGSSFNAALQALKQYGNPKEIYFVSIVASTYGLENIRRLHPEVKIWIGAEDEELTAKSYIVPGLGDAGDLAFGEKLQD
jgi:uracil phosphoribosyltransferase